MDIVVFQERGSGNHKIEGVRQFGEQLVITLVINIEMALPDFIDEPEDYIDTDFTADLILNFLKHPDLVDHLVHTCERKHIPVVSPGKKCVGFTPFTCCGLGRDARLGKYGEQFGVPEYHVVLNDDGTISDIRVLRGAPCGATWVALQEYVGCRVDDVLTRLPRQVQYFCSADPSGFDPVSGKSPVHYAGYVHIAALKKAIDNARG